jgi:glyoxalase family protein
MRLHGLHHITMITGDAQRTVDFYAGTLGLRLVKTTVNFDDPGAYHLYFGDETGAPGTILTWFEYAGAAPGRAGAGMIHTIQLGVASPAALDFWQARLGGAGVRATRDTDSLLFEDPEGLGLELVVADPANAPLAARHPEVPDDAAITGIEGARAYSTFHALEESLLTRTLGFTHLGAGRYLLEGAERRARWTLDRATANGRPGAGTVHHIAWCSADADHGAWRDRVTAAGGYVTDVVDRDYFLSIYFREPRGVLFEIATVSPGFAVDEDPEHLGESLRIPAMHAHLRDELERTLTPIVNPRVRHRA